MIEFVEDVTRDVCYWAWRLAFDTTKDVALWFWYITWRQKFYLFIIVSCIIAVVRVIIYVFGA